MQFKKMLNNCIIVFCQKKCYIFPVEQSPSLLKPMIIFVHILASQFPNQEYDSTALNVSDLSFLISEHVIEFLCF